MVSLSNLNMALGSARNENTLALANLNFDFSLFKVEAPKEYNGLGSALSNQRRIDAETGTPHKTARRLGALFEQVIPEIPALKQAYGRRVSAISESPNVNPRPSTDHGVFSAQVGADGTAIWAAATSGSSAIAVNLLACMLARIWSGPEAISVWVEMVAERKKEIIAQCDGSRSVHYTALMAAQQDITRKQLAEWDANARAWLRSADEAMKMQQTQLMLIIKNVNISVNNIMNTYPSVMQAWKIAMTSVDKLIRGSGQNVQNGAVLLGLSVWHLYPVLYILQTSPKKVTFDDQLVSQGGVLTIGLHNAASDQPGGVSWSLPLAYLRYYGEPVVSSGSVGPGTGRLTMEQLAQVALGCTFRGWEYKGPLLFAASHWFVSLWQYLSRARAYVQARSPLVEGDVQLPNGCHGPRVSGHSMHSQDITEAEVLTSRPVNSSDSTLEGEVGYSSLHSAGPNGVFVWIDDLLTSQNWLRILATAAQQHIQIDDPSHGTSATLVRFGQRQGNSLLGDLFSHSAPLFGLSDLAQLIPLLKDEEERIKILRSLVSKRSNLGRGWIIRYRVGDSQRSDPFEYATAARSEADSKKRRQDEMELPTQSAGKYERWVAVTASCAHIAKHLQTSHWSTGESCKCFRCLEGRRPCLQDQCCFLCHPPSSESFCDDRFLSPEEQKLAENRASAIAAATGEQISTYIEQIQASERKLFKWHNPPLFLRSDGAELSHEDPGASSDAPPDRHDLIFDFYAGDLDTAAIFIRRDAKHGLPDRLDALPSAPTAEETLRAVTLAFDSDYVRPEALRAYFNRSISTDKSTYFRSLKVLATATAIYQPFPNATVSMDITTSPLHRAKWVPDPPNNNRQNVSKHLQAQNGPIWLNNVFGTYSVTRSQAFACVVLFESGCHDIAPNGLKSVMALSSGDSIFVAKSLLCDPVEEHHMSELRRVLGNVGHPGIAMLIPPANPRVRQPDLGCWKVISHAPFDGGVENHFQDTSLHLGFTEYESPIDAGLHGARDKTLSFLETLVQVRDRGRWVADLDILSALESHQLIRPSCTCDCVDDVPRSVSSVDGQKSSEPGFATHPSLTAIDNWEEFLDRPPNASIFRAHGNWLARLAATSINISQAHKTIVLPTKICWRCSREPDDEIVDDAMYIC